MLLARWKRFSSPTVTTVGVVLMGVPTKYCTSRSERASKKDLTNLLPGGCCPRPKLSLLHANELSEGNKVILVGVRNERLVNTGRRSACWQERQIKDLRKASDSRANPGKGSNDAVESAILPAAGSQDAQTYPLRERKG